MLVETEIKLRLPQGLEGAKALLEQHGFRATGPRQLEADQLFDLPSGELRQSGRVLRLRSAGGKWVLTYKGAADKTLVDDRRYKSREEIETVISDGHGFELILAGLGYQRSFAYEKFRTTFAVPGDDGIATLDETPIGDFLELEGPGYWIDRTAQQLGFGPGEYVTSSYATLYEEYRRKHEAGYESVPRDMRFHCP